MLARLSVWEHCWSGGFEFYACGALRLEGVLRNAENRLSVKLLQQHIRFHDGVFHRAAYMLCFSVVKHIIWCLTC